MSGESVPVAVAIDMDVGVAPASAANSVKRAAVLTLFVHHPPQAQKTHEETVKNFGHLSELHTITVPASDGMSDEQVGVKVAALRGLFYMLEQSMGTHDKLNRRFKPWRRQPDDFTLVSVTMMDLRGRPAPDDEHYEDGQHDNGPIQLKECDYFYIEAANELVSQFRVMKEVWEENN